MKRSRRLTPYGFLAACVLTGGVLAAFHGAAAQEQEKFTNLKVLPKDVSEEELRATMGQFTRALGVRCNFCHAAKAGEQRLDFALDDKPEKKTARAMMEMTRDLNDKYLSALEERGNPPVKVGCFTCHHGTNRPRTLQDVLKTAYAHGGIDSTRARYSSLHDRYYGSAAYDFGEVPLADVAQSLADSGRVADAVNLLAMNVDMNPKSAFAQRQLAAGNVLLAFSDQGGDSGVAVYQRSKSQLGQPREQEGLVAGIGGRLMRTGKTESAIAAYKLNTTEHPQSGDAFSDLGGAYLKHGDKKLAIDAYLMAVSLDPMDTTSVKQLQSLKVSKGKIEKAQKQQKK